MIRYFIIIYGILLGVFYFGQASFGAEPVLTNLDGVVLNEILPNPKGSDSDGGEFIELYNSSGDDIDIAGWNLADNNDKSDKIIDYTGIYDWGPAGTIISSDGYAVIVDSGYYREQYSEFLEKYAEDFPCVMLTTDEAHLGSTGLVNSKDTIELTDLNNNKISFSWENAPDGISYEKNDPLLGDDPLNWTRSGNLFGSSPGIDNNDPPVAKIQVDKTSGPPPLEVSFNASNAFDPENALDSYDWDFGDGNNGVGINVKHTYQQAGLYIVALSVTDKQGLISSEPATVTISIYSNKIIINEILPDPAGTDSGYEWVELYNSGDENYDLVGWRLGDKGGARQDLSGIISAKKYLLYRTTFSLNNSGGDTIYLFYPDSDQIADQVTYPDAESAQSWARKNSDLWFWTTTSTPGAQNIFTLKIDSDDEINIPILSISFSKQKPKGTKVIVYGTVTLPPNTASSKYFYIQDQSGGIQIYHSDGQFPSLKSGDYVRILGKMSSISREIRINIADEDDITIIRSERSPPVLKIKVKEAASNLGRLVKISGRVVKSSGSTFWINDGSGEIRIYVNTINIAKPRIQKGDWVSVIGVVSKSANGFRILVRSAHEISVRGAKNQTKPKSSSSKKTTGSILGIDKAQAAENSALAQDWRAQDDNQVKNNSLRWPYLGMAIGILGLVLLVGYPKFKKIYYQLK